jgi:hypothetical protein
MRCFRLVTLVLLAIVAGSVLMGSGITQALTFQQGGSTFGAGSILNIIQGTGMTITHTFTGGVASYTFNSSGGGSSFYQTVQVAGSPLPQEPVLNFPANMTCVDNPGNTSTDCTPSGGGSSVPTSGWTLQNAVNSDLTFNNFAGNAVAMSMQAINTSDAGMTTQAIPGATYTVTATLNCIGPNVQLNSQLCGLGLFDGTKAETIEILQQAAMIGVGLRVTTWSNLHAGTITAIHGPTYAITGTQPTFKVHDDGTTRTWSYYENGAFVSFYSEASGTFLTPTAVGPLNFCDIAGITGNPAYCTTQFLTWAATSP